MKQELQDLLSECTDELNDIESRINDLPALDKARCYLTNYALIRACGTVEFVYRSIVADHFSQLGNPRLDTYLDSTIRQGSNSAKYDNMKSLLKKFDPQWSSTFSNLVTVQTTDGQRLISASNSLVANRHQFAHGRQPRIMAFSLKIQNFLHSIWLCILYICVAHIYCIFLLRLFPHGRIDYEFSLFSFTFY